MHSNLRLYLQPITAVVPNVIGNRDQFGGRQLFYGLGVRGWFVVIQAHDIYCTLNLYYYYIGSTSDP